MSPTLLLLALLSFDCIIFTVNGKNLSNRVKNDPIISGLLRATCDQVPELSFCEDLSDSDNVTTDLQESTSTPETETETTVKLTTNNKEITRTNDFQKGIEEPDVFKLTTQILEMTTAQEEKTVKLEQNNIIKLTTERDLREERITKNKPKDPPLFRFDSFFSEIAKESQLEMKGTESTSILNTLENDIAGLNKIAEKATNTEEGPLIFLKSFFDRHENISKSTEMEGEEKTAKIAKLATEEVEDETTTKKKNPLLLFDMFFSGPEKEATGNTAMRNKLVKEISELNRMAQIAAKTKEQPLIFLKNFFDRQKNRSKSVQIDREEKPITEERNNTTKLMTKGELGELAEEAAKNKPKTGTLPLLLFDMFFSGLETEATGNTAMRNKLEIEISKLNKMAQIAAKTEEQPLIFLKNFFNQQKNVNKSIEMDQEGKTRNVEVKNTTKITTKGELGKEKRKNKPKSGRLPLLLFDMFFSGLEKGATGNTAMRNNLVEEISKLNKMAQIAAKTEEQPLIFLKSFFNQHKSITKPTKNGPNEGKLEKESRKEVLKVNSAEVIEPIPSFFENLPKQTETTQQTHKIPEENENMKEATIIEESPSEISELIDFANQLQKEEKKIIPKSVEAWARAIGKMLEHSEHIVSATTRKTQDEEIKSLTKIPRTTTESSKQNRSSSKQINENTRLSGRQLFEFNCEHYQKHKKLCENNRNHGPQTSDLCETYKNICEDPETIISDSSTVQSITAKRKPAEFHCKMHKQLYRMFCRNSDRNQRMAEFCPLYEDVCGVENLPTELPSSEEFCEEYQSKFVFFCKDQKVQGAERKTFCSYYTGICS